MTISEKISNWYRKLPDKKRYFEFVTAVLSIPVLLTVILLNLNSLNNNKDKEKTTTQPTIIKEIIVSPSESNQAMNPTQELCKKEVGHVKITFPKEGERVSQDPLCVTISYKTGEYCSVVWSYRINSGPWSDFSDKSVCLFNLSSGEKKFELRVKSVVSDDEESLERNFIYEGSGTTPTSAATQSSSL